MSETRSGATIAVRAICVMLAAGLAAAPGAWADDEFVAYASTKKGEFPLPENVDDIEDKHLIVVRWGDYQGPQQRVAVLPVDNSSSGQSTFEMFTGFDPSSGQVPVNGIEAMITDSMARSGRFRMLERVAVGSVLSEQDLAADGRTTAQSAAATGQVLGAQYLVQAVVTSYEPDYKSKKGGLGAITKGLAGGASFGKSKSMVGMNFRLIDAATSEILFTRQVDVVTSATEFNTGGLGWGGSSAYGGFMSSYSSTPVGQAVMAAVNQGVYELVKQIGSSPAAGAVIKASDGQVYLNLGDDTVDLGDLFTAIRHGDELIDPDTGLSLGGEDEVLGKLEVVDVKDKFCVARPVGFDSEALARGDQVISTEQAVPLQFASVWQGPKK